MTQGEQITPPIRDVVIYVMICPSPATSYSVFLTGFIVALPLAGIVPPARASTETAETLDS